MPKTPDYFVGKTIVITGAASGIGRATSLIFARERANVVCADLNADGARRTAEAGHRRGRKALALTIDVTPRAQVNDAVARAIAAFGRVDFLFNSAGAAIRRGKFLEIDDALLEQTFDLNVNGTFYAMQAVLPHMLENSHGVIVNIARMSHKRGGPGASVHYAAAKGAVVTMTLGVAREFADHGIRAPVDLARADEHAVPGGGGYVAGVGAEVHCRRADEADRGAGRNRRTGAVHVLGCLSVHDGGHGVCERRRRVALTFRRTTRPRHPGRGRCVASLLLRRAPSSFSPIFSSCFFCGFLGRFLAALFLRRCLLGRHIHTNHFFPGFFLPLVTASLTAAGSFSPRPQRSSDGRPRSAR